VFTLTRDGQNLGLHPARPGRDRETRRAASRKALEIFGAELAVAIGEVPDGTGPG
jgi:hypothetical protein